MSEVELKNISKYFGNTTAVDNISLKIENGEFISLLGPSGCGKSTTLRMIAGLEDIDKGTLLIDQKVYNNIPTRKRGISMVFQSYALFPHMNVAQNICFGLKVQKVPKDIAKKKLEWAVNLTGLTGLEKRLPKELSGGQRQRVALGRALVLDPKVLLLDEPLSNLDSSLRDKMTAELKRIHRQIGKTIVYVTHNQVEALTLSDRIAVMHQGKIVQCDSPNNIYNYPVCEFVAKFIGTPQMNLFYAQAIKVDGSVELLLGSNNIKVGQATAEQLTMFVGQKLQVGLRPQHIYHHLQKVGKRHTDTKIIVEVDVVQSLGEKNLIVAKLQDMQIVFMIDPDILLEPGQNIPIVIDGRKLHLFDKDTCERIFK